jgi:hypothetical protein
MRSFISTQKELNKEFITKFERFDALNEKVDHLTTEIATMKNNTQEKKNEESIKYVQDIIDRSWEIAPNGRRRKRIYYGGGRKISR